VSGSGHGFDDLFTGDQLQPVLKVGEYAAAEIACSGNWGCTPSHHVLVGALRMPPHETRPRGRMTGMVTSGSMSGEGEQ
jgi:hypothetical protein